MNVNPRAGIASAKVAAWNCHIISNAMFSSVVLFAASIIALCVAIVRANNAERVDPETIASCDHSAPRPPRHFTSVCNDVMNRISKTMLRVSRPEVILKAPWLSA